MSTFNAIRKNKFTKPIVIVSALAISGAILWSQSRTTDPVPAVFSAVRHSDVPAVLDAINHRSSVVRDTDLDGNTSLHIASILGSTDVVNLLLAHNADPNLPNARGYTPLLFTLLSNRPQPAIIHALLKAGADPLAKSPAGETPLQLATRLNLNPAILAALNGNPPQQVAAKN